MALVVTTGFPRDMPEYASGFMPLRTATFQPAYGISRSPTRGGRPQSASVARDYWTMDFTSVDLRYDDALDYEAWLHSLRGGQRYFKAWHPHLRYPLAYKATGLTGLTRAGGGSFDGTSPITAFAGTLDTITLSTLPVGFNVSRGDMLSMAFGSVQLLHRVIAGGLANGSGALTVTVEPTLPISFTTSPTVTANFVKPWCVAVVDPSSVKASYSDGLYGTLQFSAQQAY